MAIGKNQKMGKKGSRKKTVDPMTRKDWYTVKAPGIFAVRDFCKTLVNRTAGLKTSTDSLKGRVFEVSLADLNKDEDQFFRKIKLCVEEISGNECLTNFHGMDFTRDKLCSLVKKWHSLVEAWVDVKTTDGYLLRLFCIGFTKRRKSQMKKTSYAKASQKKAIRAKMVEVMRKESSCDLKDLFSKFAAGVIGKEIEKVCNSIYPLTDVFVRKAKVLKKPKFDLSKLMEVHEGGQAVAGAKVDRDEDNEIEETVEGSGGRL